jgi:predicted N-acetyltransferase YhbS
MLRGLLTARANQRAQLPDLSARALGACAETNTGLPTGHDATPIAVNAAGRASTAGAGAGRNAGGTKASAGRDDSFIVPPYGASPPPPPPKDAAVPDQDADAEDAGPVLDACPRCRARPLAALRLSDPALNSDPLHQPPSAALVHNTDCTAGQSSRRVRSVSLVTPPRAYTRAPCTPAATRTIGTRLANEITRAQPHWYVHLMAVHPDLQGQGYGSRLLARVLAQTLERDPHLPTVLTTHLPENLVFYRRAGFETIGERTLAPPGGEPYTVWSMARSR